MMRVVAGRLRGMRLRTARTPGFRPTSGRVREALFSILGDEVRDRPFLDLFAGVGGVGIEALSRGAVEAVFVEQAGAAVRTIGENLTHTRLEAGARVVRADVFGFLAPGAGLSDPFEYVYVAPPQYHGLWVQTLQALDARPGWLAADAWVIDEVTIPPCFHCGLHQLRTIIAPPAK